MRQMTTIFPEEELTVVCRHGLGDIIRTAGVADHVIEVNKRDRGQWRQQRQQILALNVNHLVCPHESPRTAVLVRQMKVKGLKVGFETWWNAMIFDKRVKKPMHLPDALRQLSLLTALNNSFAEEFSEISGREDVFNPEDSSARVDFRHGYIPVWAEIVDSRGVQGKARTSSKTVYIAPGSVWATKRWTLTGYIELAKALSQEGWRVEVVGAPDERPLGELIQKSVPEVKNHAGEWSASETVAHFRQGKMLIANDSGAIHMAAMAALPTVAVFGPTTLALGFRPWQRQAIVVQKDLKCRPCGKHGHQKCPIGTHECMNGLSVGEVLKAAREFLV